MKITSVLGSPRMKGNTAYLANIFNETAKEKGADVESFTLNRLKYKGCQACFTCKTKLEKCVLNDDLTQVLETIGETDILVMTSPVYYGDVSSQLKSFIDRTFSFLVPDYTTNPKPSRLTPGKKLLFILAQGQPDEKAFSDSYPKYSQFFNWYGFETSHLVRGCGVYEKTDAEKRTDLADQIRKIANEWIVE